MNAKGEKVRVLREAKGLSQKDLGRKVGYQERTIRKVEKGGSVSLAVLEDLADCFSVPLEEIAWITPNDYPGEVLGIAQILDLRTSGPAGRQASQIATLANRYLFALRPGSGRLTFRAASSGKSVELTCITPGRGAKARPVTRATAAGDRVHSHAWFMDVDVRDIPEGKPFVIDNQIRYQDAFKTPEQWSFHTHVEFDALWLTMILLFPDRRVPSQVIGKHRTSPNPTAALEVSENQPMLLLDRQVGLWRLDGPRRGDTYQIEWNFKDP